jgi:hypothetical protein
MSLGSGGLGGRIAIALGVGAAIRQGGLDVPPKAFYVLEHLRPGAAAEVIGTYGSIEAASGAIDIEVGEQHGRFDDYAISTVRTTPHPIFAIAVGIVVFLAVIFSLGTLKVNLVVVFAAAAASAFLVGDGIWLLLRNRFQHKHAREWQSMGAG